ncbi:MAG TPA: hypothetical protein VEN28_08870 [Burkholderiaceae bacterium]|nr:hypothetical protein [Burkholderiaceae bacterium]
MRPASKRVLLERLAAVAPMRGARVWSVLALIAVAAVVISRFFGGSEGAQRPVNPETHGAPVLDPVLALPFGEGGASVAAPTRAADNGRIEELRTAYRSTDDRLALYRQLRERPEADARYLAFRAARDCELLRAGAGVVAELDAISERKGERERQMAAATTRCRGFLSEPAARDEVQRLEEEAATAGHPAAQIALAADSYAQHPLAETVATLRRGLASGDPLAFDEARVLLAMTRHQVEIAGVAPITTVDPQATDTRVAAIDLVGCRLGNPCGPSRGAVAIECGANASCLRDAEEWLLQSADFTDEERRATLALAERLLAAFKRGAVDEIVRLPVRTQP